MKNLLLLLLVVAAFARADAPNDYAFGIALTTHGDAPFYRVELPPAVYAGVSRADLADLRVFNADNATVPFALLTREASTIPSDAAVALPLFPLKTSATASDLSGLTMHFDRTLAGTSLRVATRHGKPVRGDRLIGYVLDASDTTSPLKAIVLVWPAASGSMTRHLKIDASDDLVAWRTLVADAAIIDLQFEGRRLLRNHIELPATKFRYLRVIFNGGDGPFEIASAAGLPPDAHVEPTRQWRDMSGTPVAQRDGEFEFDLGAKAPIDRVTIDLPEVNSVVPAELLSRDAAAAPWTRVTSLIAYRLHGGLHGGEQDLTPAPVAIAPTTARYWLLRVDPRAGGLHGVPHLRAGGPTQEIIFAARGRGPYTLAYGSATAHATMLPIATLVPGYATSSSPPIAAATAATDVPQSLGGSARLTPSVDTKRYLLWGVLVLGVALMGWMAWRLSTQMKSGTALHEERTPEADSSAATQSQREA